LTIHRAVTRMSCHILNPIILNLGLTWSKCITSISVLFANLTFPNHEYGSKFTVFIIIEYLKLIGVFLMVCFNHLLVINFYVFCFLFLFVFSFFKVDPIGIDLSRWDWIKGVKFIIVLMPTFISNLSSWIHNLLWQNAVAGFHGHSLLRF
jgi:hypothetical protein